MLEQLESEKPAVPACAVCGRPFVLPAVWSGTTTPEPTPSCECHAVAEVHSVGPQNQFAQYLTPTPPPSSSILTQPRRCSKCR